MSTLLHLDSSPLPSSVTRELGREFIKTWQAANPASRVIYRDLAANPPTLIDATWVGAAYTPAAARTPEQASALMSPAADRVAFLEPTLERVRAIAA